jgi:hypothetical protein
MKYEKVFVIGFNKTASTSFHKLFVHLGLPSVHTREWKYKKYTCFSDGKRHTLDGPDNFKSLEQRFPNALFILNTRPLSQWLFSRAKHGIIYPRKWSYPATHEKFIKWINSRNSFHDEVLSFFFKNLQTNFL